MIAYKLSLGPNTFVGIAEVKLDPCSSWYALTFLFSFRNGDRRDKNISRDAPINNIDHPLCVRVTVVALMRWSEMDLGLVERVCNLIREHTGR